MQFENFQTHPNLIWFFPESPNLFSTPTPKSFSIQHTGLFALSSFRLQCSPGPSLATHLKTFPYSNPTLAHYPMTPCSFSKYLPPFEILFGHSLFCLPPTPCPPPAPSKYLFYKDRDLFLLPTMSTVLELHLAHGRPSNICEVNKWMNECIRVNFLLTERREMTGFSVNISLRRWTLSTKNKHVYSYQLVLSSLSQT